MGDDGRKILVNVILHTISITLLSIIGAYLIQSNNAADLDLSAVEQYKTDWTQPTHTKIDIDHNSRYYDICKSEYQSLFETTWPGTYEACDCRGNWHMSYYRQTFYTQSSCYADDQYYCRRVKPISSLNLEVVEGNRICGKSLGPSFVNAMRPDPKTLKCPDSYLPCSANTSPDNTICYRTSQDRDKSCPITKILFKNFNTKEEATAWAAADAYDWDLEDYDEDENVWMLWTKDADSLPITNTALESQPCMSPTEDSIYDYYKPWSNEKKKKGCSTSITNGMKNDPRYIDTGISTNLWELHEDNNVNNIMRSTYGTAYNSQEYDTKKRNVRVGLWTRPTLSWKLSCDGQQGKTRADLYKAMESPYGFPDRIFVAAVFAFICVGVEACACGCGILTSGGDSIGATTARTVAVVISGLFVINIVWMAQTGAAYLRKESEKVENYSMVNECADDITNMPVDQIDSGFQEGVDKANIAAYLTYGLLVVYVISACVIVKQFKEA